MLHFLDFDRTLFDTDSFLKDLPNVPGCASFKDELEQVIAGSDTWSMDKGRQEVWSKITAALKAGTLSFAPGELERFVYPDAFELLRSLGNEAVIITFGDVARQKAKIESALANAVRITVLYTGDQLKGDYLKTWPGYYGQAALYTDDRVHELETMTSAFPAIRAFEMRRDGASGDGRWPVIHSLHDLPAA